MATPTTDAIPLNTCVTTGPSVLTSQAASGISTVFHTVSTRFITAPSAMVSCCHRGCKCSLHRVPISEIRSVKTGCSTLCHRAVSRSVKP